MKTFLMTCLACLLALPAAQAVPLELPVQGVIRDNAGQPVVEGIYEMTFTIYAGAETEEPLWSETKPVEAQGGQFRLNLGTQTPLSLALFSASGGLWLGVSVEGEPELPRRPMGSTPYALQAARAAGLNCTGCVSPQALSEETLQVIRDEAIAAGTNAGYASDAASLAYDDSAAALGASSVQDAIDTLKGLLDEQAVSAGPSDLNEGAGTISRISNQWGLPSYGTAVEYIHLMNPNPPKVLLHLYGGENTGFASSNNLIVSNSFTPNTYSGGANGEADDDTLTVSNAGAFNQGDHILIHQTVGTNHGQWELNAVQAINGNSLKLAKPLVNTYSSDSNTGTGQMNRAQVVIAASYNTFEVISGGSVYPSSALSTDGGENIHGGIVYIRARQMTVKGGGEIHADGRGYHSQGWCGWNCPSYPGDSECGTAPSNTYSNNCSGGGGGESNSSCNNCYNSAGGGGGNKTAGGNGVSNGCKTGGTGGSAKGAEGDGLLHFGGAGGTGGYPYGGQHGGGLVVLGTETLIVESGGSIRANGDNGGGEGACHGGGGGGAGGTVAIFADNVSIDGTVEARGGQGANGSNNIRGGNGGEGWVHQMAPIPGIINQSYATGVEIWVDDQEITPTVGDPNGKGLPHWNAAEEAWGGTGTEPWSSGPLDLTSAADWTLGEHKIEFKETGGAGGDLKAYLYLIQTFTESTPPVNDTCTTPVSIDLSEGPVVVSGTTEDVMGKTKATNAHSAACGGAEGPEVTYRIDLEERSLINVASVSPFPLRLYLRSGECEEGEVVYCALDEFTTTPLEPGTYFLIADSDTAQAKGDFNLAVSLTPAVLPDNDTCDSAMTLFFSGTDVATDLGSTLYGLDQYETWCGGGGGPEVVYAFEAPSGKMIDISVESDDFAPLIYLYKDVCGEGTPLSCVASNSLTTSPQPGGQYWLVVDSAGEAQWGSFDLTVAFIDP